MDRIRIQKVLDGVCLLLLVIGALLIFGTGAYAANLALSGNNDPVKAAFAIASVLIALAGEMIGYYYWSTMQRR